MSHEFGQRREKFQMKHRLEWPRTAWRVDSSIQSKLAIAGMGASLDTAPEPQTSRCAAFMSLHRTAAHRPIDSLASVRTLKRLESRAPGGRVRIAPRAKNRCHMYLQSNYRLIYLGFYEIPVANPCARFPTRFTLAFHHAFSADSISHFDIFSRGRSFPGCRSASRMDGCEHWIAGRCRFSDG